MIFFDYKGVEEIVMIRFGVVFVVLVFLVVSVSIFGVNSYIVRIGEEMFVNVSRRVIMDCRVFLWFFVVFRSFWFCFFGFFVVVGFNDGYFEFVMVLFVVVGGFGFNIRVLEGVFEVGD